MDEEKIILDRKSFEALAVESRVRILKSLKQRRKTLSEIAKEQDMSVSGVKEHLENLEQAGLIKKIDDGHKWKYYELTQKGSGIVEPKELKVWVLLSISTIALVSSLLAIFYGSMIVAENQTITQGQIPTVEATSEGVAAPEMAAPFVMENGTDDASVPTNELQKPQAQTVVPDFQLPIVIAAASIITILACLFMLSRNRSISKGI